MTRQTSFAHQLQKGHDMTNLATNHRKISQLGTQLEHGPRVRIYRKGRKCAVDDCDARLSVYNPGQVCALHTLGY